MKRRITTWILALVSSIGLMTNAKADDAKPWTFWYWMNGAVTREGITADLEAMAEIGLEGCYLMPIYGIERAPQLGGTIRQGTPEWWQMVDFALHEADRLGLKIGMHICDGFALAGGPWITPEQSMQNVVSTDTVVTISAKNGAKWNKAWLPAAPKGFYKDIATYAMPLSYQPSTANIKPIIASDNTAFTIDAKGRLKCKEPCRFSYSYAQPVTVSALRITTYNNSLQALRMKVYALNEEGGMQLLKQIVPPRHGWQNYDSPTTVALPTVTTRQLMFEWTPEGTEPGSEDLDNGKWGKVLKIEKMEVLATPRVDDWEGKSGRVWRVSSEEQSVTSPEMYVPLDRMIQLKAGTILPKGEWRIVRIGHASTLHENATGGDCKGLECDKFSRHATQCQLDNWFGAAFKNCDAEVAHRVLKYMHVDSWECSCQNWSDNIETATGTENFAQYFSRQHGYDLMPYLPLLVGIPMVDCTTTERVLRDVRNTIAELVDEEFYPTLVNEARKQGCLLSAESVAPTMVSDGMQHYRHADVPMGEFWLNSPTHDKPNDMLDAISGGHVWGKQIIQAEGFTQLRGLFSEVPAQLKPLLDKQYCLGINRLFFHVYALNPDPQKKPGMTLDGIGLFFQRTQPWWPEGKAFVDYITRCQRLLQQGRPIVDVAVYTGHEMPRRAILPERLNPLPGYLYDSYNFGALLEPVKSPYRPRYKVFVLPGARKMDPDNQPLTDAAKLGIEHLKSLGLKIIDGVPTTQLLKDLGIQPDVICPEDILFTHRMLDNGDIYFLSNQKGEERQVEVSFRDHRNRPGIIYDAVTDTHFPLRSSSAQATGHVSATITLPAYGSCFVLFGLMEGKAAQTVETAQKTIVPWNRTTPYHLFFTENGITMQSNTLPDWSKLQGDSLQYYSGRVRYTFSFKYKARKNPANRVYLLLDDLHDVATVCLNGINCGSTWTAPYEIDVTEALQNGNNVMELWVANSWNNAILGNDSGHAPFGNIWTNAKYRDPKTVLLPAGVGGLRLETR